jgi:hypothetical protein
MLGGEKLQQKGWVSVEVPVRRGKNRGPGRPMCRSSFLAVLSQPEHLAAQVEIVAQVFGRPLVDHPAALQRYRGIRQR